MSKTVLDLRIDRIVLSGLDIDPGRVDSLRLSIGLELQKALAKGGLGDELADREASRISVPAVKSSDLRSEGQIAGHVAGSVYRILGGQGLS